MFRVIMVFKYVQIVDEILKSRYEPALSGRATSANVESGQLFSGASSALLSALLSAGVIVKISISRERLHANSVCHFVLFCLEDETCIEMVHVSKLDKARSPQRNCSDQSG